MPSVFQGLAQDTSVQGILTAFDSTLATIGGGTQPAKALVLGVRGSDGKIYSVNGIGATDSGVALQVYIGGASAQGTRGVTPGTAMYQVGFYDAAGKLNSPNMDAAGALAIQAGGTPGSPAPTIGLQVGGRDNGGSLRALSVDANGKVSLQSATTLGATAPSSAVQLGGVDSGGMLRAASVSTGGALSIQDASTVPEAPLSLNGTAFVLGQAGAPSSPITLADETSHLILPDSTGPSSINGIRGQLEMVNLGNVDVCVSPSLATVWGCLWLIRPGGSLVTTYSGPVSAIHNGTANGAAVTTPAPSMSVAEWA